MAREQAFDETAVAAALAGLPHWAHVGGALQRRYPTTSFKAALMVTAAIGHLCEAAWHHPEITVAYSGVTVRLWTHTADGVTAKDVELAALIERTVGWRPGASPAGRAGSGALTGPPAAHAILRRDPADHDPTDQDPTA